MDAILEEVIPYLPDSASLAIRRLPFSLRRNLREIRIKAGCPMLLYSSLGRTVCEDCVHTSEEVNSTFRKICASSSYTHRNEIRAGFVTLPGGHRVGILGCAVMGEDGRVEGMRDIYGLIFRIAREYEVPLDDILSRIYCGDRLRNVLIAGPPCSGKTTFLRALAKKLSENVQVSVVDEREELFPATRAVPVGCDVLRGYPKAVGVLQALRTLSPRVIVCDEIGSGEEVLAMGDGLQSGVSFFVSAHAYTAAELMSRPPVRELVRLGGIDFAVFLDPKQMGTIVNIEEREDLCAEISTASSGVSSLCGGWGDLCL